MTDADAIDGVVLTPLRQIHQDAGSVYHVLKRSEATFETFGETYFSTVDKGAVKGWKRHRRMVCNLAVPCGGVRFHLFDGREGSPSAGAAMQVDLSPDAYRRLTIPPMVWFAFEGLGAPLNLLVNVASIEHDPDEAEGAPLSDQGPSVPPAIG